MKKLTFVGRQAELDRLQLLLKRKLASIVVIKGRRRIGKSRLVEEFAKQLPFYRFSGLAPEARTSAQDQRDEFMRQYATQTGFPFVKLDDWHQVFMLLAERFKAGRVVIFFDELSWMGSKDQQFLAKLKNVWDMYFKQNPQLILVLCSSISQWIEKNVVSSTSYFGRISTILSLHELPLNDCNQLLTRVGFKGTSHEKLALLAITGGVPWYIENIQPNLSAIENIRQLCFMQDGLLVDEFQRIFHDLFSDRSTVYQDIVTCLVDGAKTYSDIAECLNYPKSGTLSNYLKDLVQSGFISKDTNWSLKSGKALSTVHYRLSDNYLNFYLKYIGPSRDKINKQHFVDFALSTLIGWDSIMGLQFENLVLNNRRMIQAALHIRPEDIIVDDPFYQTKTRQRQGCQIDYLIQTKHKVLYAIEVKFSRNTIGIEVVTAIQEKIRRLQLPRGYVCHPVLLHASRISEAILEADYFFDTIDFANLLVT